MERTVKYIVYGILIAILVLVIIKASNNMFWLWENATLIAGWVLFGCKYVFDKEDRVYWLIKRTEYWLINPETLWELSVRYEVPNIDDRLIIVLQKHLCELASLDSPKIRCISNQRFEVTADELHIEVFVDDGYINVFFAKIPVTFRGSERVIKARISPVLEAIENKIVTKEKIYWLNVYFGRINPYFGLYMRRLHQKDIFEMNIRLRGSDSEGLDISKQKIKITTETLTQLGNSVSKYLTLSKLPA